MNSSAGSEGRAAYILAQLNAGLVTQWSQIVELDASLQHLLNDAHSLAQPHVLAERRSSWDEAWRGLRSTLGAIRALDAEAQKRFTTGDKPSDPLEPWSDIFEHERKFSDHLAVILDIAEKSVPAKDRSTWRELCRSLELTIATLNAHVLTVRFQLELRQKYGRQKADAVTQEMLKRFTQAREHRRSRQIRCRISKGLSRISARKGNVWGRMGRIEIAHANPAKGAGRSSS